MTLPEHLYKLQQYDREIESNQQELDTIDDQLSDNRALTAAESALASHREHLENLRKKQKTAEWELEDLQEKARQTNSRLYGGATKNPKELVNLEKEAAIFKSQISRREDALLVLLSETEEAESRVDTFAREFEHLVEEWKQKRETLVRRKDEVEAVLGKLKETRAGQASQIDSAALELYERIRMSKGLAVVKVERGRCQGCHITVPTSQWQKAKAGNVIQCSSCNRILS